MLYDHKSSGHDSVINVLSKDTEKEHIGTSLQKLLDEIKDPQIVISRLSKEYVYRPMFKLHLPNPKTSDLITIEYNDFFSWGRIKGSSIGYLNVKNFGTRLTYKQMEQVLDSMLNISDKIIIDLRNTIGTHWEKSHEMASYLVSYSGVYMHWRFRSKKRTPLKPEWHPMKIQSVRPRAFSHIAILQSRQTQLASEVMIFALKNMKNTTTIGDTTWGNLAIKEIMALSSGYFIEYPAGVFGSFEKENFHKVGIPPDHYVKPSQQDDFILKKALEILR